MIRDVQPATPRANLVRVELGDHAFQYKAGQAVLVAAPGRQTRWPYSIASSPEDARQSGIIDLLVGVDDGPERFVPAAGDSIEVEGPFGSFTFPEKPLERRFLFIAGGTGIAPLRSMMRHALGMPHERIGLFYSARAADEFAFGDEFRALAAAGAIDLRETVTRGGGAPWTGARGRLTIDALRELIAGGDTLCFVCGPSSMVDDVPKLLEQSGIRREGIRIEEWQQRDT
ncbi:MAG TPA: hypothetical protein VEU08_24175 [Vicinamibacterales bacterium]|nr:hypothetical protein [Vicinamibacterales bacterium]